MTSQPPPGWYPNPQGRTQWWDGSRWGQLAPDTSVAPAPAAEVPPPPASAPGLPPAYSPSTPPPYATGAYPTALYPTAPHAAAPYAAAPSAAAPYGAAPYGAAQYPTGYVEVRPVKDAGIAYIFVLLLGGFGAHRFYLRRTGSAIAMLLLTCLGWVLSFVIIGIPILCGVLVWLIIDLFLIPGMVREENAKLFPAAYGGPPPPMLLR